MLDLQQIPHETFFFSCEPAENNIEIAKILPHRYPFLLVDKVIHLEKMKRAVGVKSLERLGFWSLWTGLLKIKPVACRIAFTHPTTKVYPW